MNDLAVEVQVTKDREEGDKETPDCVFLEVYSFFILIFDEF